MKVYEAMILYDPEFGRDESTAKDYSRELIEKCGGEVIRSEKYAEQKLAYEIKKRKRGVYALTAMRMDPARVAELERNLTLDENVLRSLILDRTGQTLDRFFQHYEPSEEEHDDDDRDFRGRDRGDRGDRGGRGRR